MRTALVLAAAVLGVGVLVLRAGDRGSGAAGPFGAGTLSGRAGAAVERFFAGYVTGEGRVVRRDEGGDTVSEGQAYALLLAAAAGQRDRFDRVWGWTRAHLVRDDGLLSWRWADGRVVDESAAADADLDAARALVLAGRRFDDDGLAEAGRRLATAVLDHETAEVAGELVLLPGPWAAAERVVNPSYVAPCTYAELEAATGDDRWPRLRRSGERLVDTLLAENRLPPDWARLDEQGTVRPIGSPEAPDRPPRYGPDAARVPFRLAEDCPGEGRRLAARLWPRLARLDGRGAALLYDLEGRRVSDDRHPVGLVGAAAAARAAGAADDSARLLQEAGELSRRFPTYYGTAWVALGEVLLAPGGRR